MLHFSSKFAALFAILKIQKNYVGLRIRIHDFEWVRIRKIQTDATRSIDVCA